MPGTPGKADAAVHISVCSDDVVLTCWHVAAPQWSGCWSGDAVARLPLLGCPGPIHGGAEAGDAGGR